MKWGGVSHTLGCEELAMPRTFPLLATQLQEDNMTQLGKLEIDLDAVLAEAMNHMTDPTDLRWSVGMALQELYFDRIEKLQTAMVIKHLRTVERNDQ